MNGGIERFIIHLNSAHRNQTGGCLGKTLVPRDRQSMVPPVPSRHPRPLRRWNGAQLVEIMFIFMIACMDSHTHTHARARAHTRCVLDATGSTPEVQLPFL